MKKGNYGIDAPGIVLTFTIAGIAIILIGALLTIVATYNIWIICIGIIVLAIGLGMVYSSKIGKYRMRDRVVQSLAIRGDETALDIGCGRGLLLNGIAAHLTTGKAYGVDIWNEQDLSGNTHDAVMQNAQSEGTAEKIEVKNADMRKLPFEDSSFDIIVSSMAIHNLRDETERQKALSEIARVARDNCKIVILDFKYVDDYRNILANNGFSESTVSSPQYLMFPPVRILSAQKTK